MRDLQARFQLELGEFSLDVDLVIPAQGVTAICGRSGAGKSTLLRCIAGLQRAKNSFLSLGEDCWQDDVRDVFLPTHLRPIGYVFQDAHLFSHLNVRRNLEYGWKRSALERRWLDFDSVVTVLGLERLLQRRPEGLSGGEKQRVAVARALLTSPQLLLMDEPLGGLDAEAKAEILPYIESLHARFNIPMIYISHSADEISRIARHRIFLDAGRVKGR